MMTENPNEPGAGAATEAPHEKDQMGGVAVASEEKAGQNGTAMSPEIAQGGEPAAAPGPAADTAVATGADEPAAGPSAAEPAGVAGPADAAAAPATAEPTPDFGALLDTYEKESKASI